MSEKTPLIHGKMKLWNEVCETNPATTKTVNQRGGFTAIAAQSQIKRATELWGPYGQAWGVQELNFGVIWGKDGIADEITLQGKFVYPDGCFEMATDIAYRQGNDSRKKLLTDLTTKALSKLGFNSDVFEGKFDDNKYVDTMNKKFNGDIDGEKDRLEAHLQDLMNKAGISKTGSRAVIIAIVKDVLGKATIDTMPELALVKKAIDSGDYTLDTGEKINGQL